MKPQHFAVLTGALAVVALVLILTGRPQSNQGGAAAAQASPRTVSVIGEGESRVKPDLALITVGIVEHRASAAEAEARVTASAKDVQTAVLEAGADPDHVEIGQVTVNATTYQDFAGTPRISGFEARITVQAGIRNVSKVQTLIDAALTAGATSVDGVVYTLENPESAKQAAMKAALDNARQRAAALTKAAGETLGDLQSMDVLQQDGSPAATSPGSLVYRAQVKALFNY